MLSDALLSCLIFLLGCIFVISMGVSAAALFAWGYTKDNSFFVQFIETAAETPRLITNMQPSRKIKQESRASANMSMLLD